MQSDLWLLLGVFLICALVALIIMVIEVREERAARRKAERGPDSWRSPSLPLKLRND